MRCPENGTTCYDIACQRSGCQGWDAVTRTAAQQNAEACQRDCREPVSCGWPRCDCPMQRQAA